MFTTKNILWETRRYQVYCNMYKTHAMATHHGGSGNPWDRDIAMTSDNQTAIDTDVGAAQDFHPVETDHFEDLEHNNPARLTAITRELDDLCQEFRPRKGNPQKLCIA